MIETNGHWPCLHPCFDAIYFRKSVVLDPWIGCRSSGAVRYRVITHAADRGAKDVDPHSSRASGIVEIGDGDDISSAVKRGTAEDGGGRWCADPGKAGLGIDERREGSLRGVAAQRPSNDVCDGAFAEHVQAVEIHDIEARWCDVGVQVDVEIGWHGVLLSMSYLITAWADIAIPPVVVLGLIGVFLRQLSPAFFAEMPR